MNKIVGRFFFFSPTYRSEETLALTTSSTATHEADDGHHEAEDEQDYANPEEDLRVGIGREDALLASRHSQGGQNH